MPRPSIWPVQFKPQIVTDRLFELSLSFLDGMQMNFAFLLYSSVFFSTLRRKLLWNWDRFSVLKGSKSQSVSELLHWLMGNVSNLWVKSKFGYFSAWDRSWNMWWLRQDYCTWLWSCVALVFLLWACLGLKEQFNILRSKHIDFSPQS